MNIFMIIIAFVIIKVASGGYIFTRNKQKPNSLFNQFYYLIEQNPRYKRMKDAKLILAQDKIMDTKVTVSNRTFRNFSTRVH